MILNPHRFGVDPSWASVSLLLKGQGVDGGTTFTDASTNALTPTAAAFATTSTTRSKWGASSIKIPSGAGSYALAYDTPRTGLQFPGDFTLETWMYVPSSTASMADFIVLHGGGADASGRVSFLTDANGRLWFNRYGQPDNGPFSAELGQFPVGQWCFWQVIRSGSTITLGINGVNKGALTDSATFGSYSGGLQFSRSAGTDVWYEDFRVTKGVARAVSLPSAQFPTG